MKPDNEFFFRYMHVELESPEGQKFELVYDIRETASAQAWAKSVKQAEISGLKDRDRFYNFPGQARADLNHVIEQLRHTIRQLKVHHADLDFPELDLSQLQKSINYLHFNFAHGHLVALSIRPETQDLWHQFNILLHQIEAVQYEEENKKRIDGLSTSRIIFTWNDQCAVPLTDEFYQDFYLGFDFGTAFVNYPHVGRHFYELFQAKDDFLADEHIQPFTKLSADTFLWFGPTLGHPYGSMTRNKIQEWFEKNAERFNRLGYFWGDPRLALGHIPVARLAEPLYTTAEVRDFVNHLSRFQTVSKVTVQ